MSYAKTIKDPLTTVKEIYANFGWDLTPEVMENMQCYLEENRQHKYGKHTYNIEDMGITKDDVKKLLSEYIEYFSGEEHLL